MLPHCLAEVPSGLGGDALRGKRQAEVGSASEVPGRRAAKNLWLACNRSQIQLDQIWLTTRFAEAGGRHEVRL